MEVERYILDLDRRFGLQFVGFDPWQAELLASRIEADTSRRSRNQRRHFWTKPFMRELPAVPVNLKEQASLTISYFTGRRIHLYPCGPLRHDLSQLQAVEKTYGVRLTSPEDDTGHGDSFSAMAMALQLIHECAGAKPVTAGTFQAGCGGCGSNTRTPFADVLARTAGVGRIWVNGQQVR